MLQIKRAYEKPGTKDGFRVLVDRLWPRGISKEKATLNLWLKDIAPSPELREWFNHDPKKFEEFKHRYTDELQSNSSVEELTQIIKKHKNVCLVYGAKDPAINHAVVLKNFLHTKVEN